MKKIEYLFKIINIYTKYINIQFNKNCFLNEFSNRNDIELICKL